VPFGPTGRTRACSDSDPEDTTPSTPPIESLPAPSTTVPAVHLSFSPDDATWDGPYEGLDEPVTLYLIPEIAVGPEAIGDLPPNCW
jgi:hypothetical protein